MTLSYKLLGRPGTVYEFLDKAKQTGAHDIHISISLDENSRFSVVKATTDTDSTPFTLRYRQPGNILCKLDKCSVDADTLDAVVRFADRLRERQYAVTINNKPISHAREVLAQVEDTMDNILNPFVSPAGRRCYFANN